MNQGVLWMALSIGLPAAGVIVGTVVWLVFRARERRK